MSDISTALSMNGGQLFTSNELLTCSIFNLKMFLFVLMIIVCVSVVSSCLHAVFIPIDEPIKCRKYIQEDFSNEEFYSYKDTINPGYFTYQRAALTSDSNNLVSGEAKRYITPQVNAPKPIYILEIFTNLYVLNGNPFGVEKLGIDETSFKHKYIAYLKNTKSGKTEHIGQLLKDGDGLYKLKFKSENINKYVDFNEIEIYHQSSQKETLVLRGKFTIL